jgi:hypothetical protein
MLDTETQFVPETRDGVEGWFYPQHERWLPRIAGADGDADADADKDKDKPDPKDDADADADADKDADKDKAAPKDGDLGDAGKAAIAAERKAKKAAEKRAADAEKELKKLQDADADETEKAKKRAEEAESKVSAATDKLRKANLLASLAEEGLTGAKAKAAARLLDDVEYDESTDEPTNLQDAIKAATAEYGEEMFKGAKPKPKAPGIDGGEGNEDRDGPSLTAEQLAAAKMAGMTPEEYVNFSDRNPKLPDPEKKK